MSLDLQCYLVTSGTGRKTIEVAAQAARAGVGIIQLRAKDLSANELLELTMAVAAAVETARPATKVVVNDRADVAFAARHRGAAVHGVHLGQDDIPVDAARAMLGRDAMIGLTAGTLEEIREAQQHENILGYLGVGPFRPTPTKDLSRTPHGVNGYRELTAVTQLPVVAIGDITPNDVPALAETGIAGVALVRAIMEAHNPSDVVHSVLHAWDSKNHRIQPDDTHN